MSSLGKVKYLYSENERNKFHERSLKVVSLRTIFLGKDKEENIMLLFLAGVYFL